MTDRGVTLTARLLSAAGEWVEMERTLTFADSAKTRASVPFRTGESLLVYYTLKGDRITVDYPEGWWPDQDFLRQ